MKKVFIAVLNFTLICFINNVSAQSDICKNLRGNYDRIDKKIQRLENLKLANEDFFSLMDNPLSTEGGIAEEIANYDHRIERLQKKITDGDKDPYLALDIKTFQGRIVLLDERMKRNFNKAAMARDPRFLEQQRAYKYISSDQLELKLELAKIEDQMKSNKCPAVNKNDIDDLFIEDKKDGLDNPGIDKPKVTAGTAANFKGNWTYTDPNSEDMVMNLRVDGAGTSTTGSMQFGPVGIVSKYQFNACVETGENRLRCDFTAVHEDEYKFIDAKGKLDIELIGNTLSTTWKELSAPTVRWKPGHESTIKRVRDPITMPITFTKK